MSSSVEVVPASVIVSHLILNTDPKKTQLVHILKSIEQEVNCFENAEQDVKSLEEQLVNIKKQRAFHFSYIVFL